MYQTQQTQQTKRTRLLETITQTVSEELEKENLKTYNSNKPLNTRAKLDLGKGCNKECGFCYYLTQLDSKDFLHPDNARILIAGLLDSGITQIELSGGEPTISPWYFDIIQILKEEYTKRNLPIHISIVTNGWFGNSPKNLKKYSKDLNEILFSLHGNQEEHDQIVSRKGSYQAISNCIEFLKHSNKIIRINYVVEILTPESKEILFDLLKERKIQQLNLLPINYWSDARSLKNRISDLKEQQSSSIIEFLDDLENSYFWQIQNEPSWSINPFGRNQKEFLGLNIRYHSYCDLPEEYHRYIVSHYEHCFDLNDWNKIWYPADINPKDQYLRTPTTDPKEFFKRIYPNGKKITLEASIKQASRDRLWSHYKDKNCIQCRYQSKCDGYKK